MRLSNTHKVGHRAYDNLLVDMIEKINSFITREELIKLFSDRLLKLSSFQYLVVLETHQDSIESLDDLDVFYFRAQKNEEKIQKQVTQKNFNERNDLSVDNLNLQLLNTYINDNEDNIGWGTPWTNLAFCLKFIPSSEYTKGGWVNLLYLKRATVKHPHRFLILWYPMKGESSLPDSFTQDERALYFFQNFYNLVSFSLKSKAKNIYEQKVNLLKDIAPSTISHEILTNIAQPIYTFEQIKQILYPVLKEEELVELFERNIEMLKYTREMADSLLLFTKRASNVEIVLKELFIKIKKLTKHILARDSAIIILDVDSDIVISSDEGLLMQVLTNLIINALEAYKESQKLHDREIFIRSRNIIGNQVEIEVSDNALGIPNNIAQEIFEQGFTTKKRSGHGLGLTISSYIVKYLGGSLELKNNTNYKTTFLLTLDNDYKIEQEIEEEALW